MPANIELKVRCDRADHEQIRQTLADREIGFLQLTQTDCYYTVPSGRLKLRTSSDSPPELIRYDRPDLAGDRLSTYSRLELSDAQAEWLDNFFAANWTRLATVRKSRCVAVLGRTRIHLDDVDRLGTFVELETVLSDEPDDYSAGQLEYQNVVKLLHLDRLEPVAGSYSNLMQSEGKLAE